MPSDKPTITKNIRANTFSNLFLICCAMIVLIFTSKSTVADQDGKSTNALEVTFTVPLATDLPKTRRFSKKQKIPILLMYSAEDCEYCDRLEEQVIRPMLISGEMQSKVILRKVMVDGIEQIKDFSGNNVDPEIFAEQRGIDVTPTLQLVDSLGRELIPKLIGYQGGEFFPAYLENAIEDSRNKLQNK